MFFKSKEYWMFAIKILLVMVIAFLVEFFVLEREERFNEQIDIRAELTDDQCEFADNNKIYNIEVPEKYVSEIMIEYSSGENFEYVIVSGSKTVPDKAFAKIDKAYLDIDVNSEQIQLRVDENVNAEISAIHFINKAHFRYDRYMFIVLLLMFLLLIFNKKSFFIKNQEKIFVVIVLFMGLLFISRAGFRLPSWDEQIHFENAWNNSFFTNIKTNIEIEDFEHAEGVTKQDNNIDDQEVWINYYEENSNELSVTETKSPIISYNMIAYLPSSFVLAIGRLLNIPFNIYLELGKLANLITYIIIFVIAMKLCPNIKNMIFILGMIPTCVFQASSYTYDYWVNAFIILGVGLMLEEFISLDKLNVKKFIISVIAIAVGCCPKAIYILVLIPWLFIDKDKFRDKKDKKIVYCTVAGIFAVGILSFIIPLLVGLGGGADIYTDERGGETSVGGQIKYILSNPFAYGKLLFGSIIGTFNEYMFGSPIYSFFAYSGQSKGISVNLMEILLLGTAVTETGYAVKSRKTTGKNYKIVMGSIIILTIILIWTALYLSFTPVGNSSINGVQARYYIPLLLPFYGLFYNDNITFNVEYSKYCKWITCIMVLAVCYSFYSVWFRV